MEANNRFVSITRPRDIRVTNLNTVKEVIKSIEIYYKINLLKTRKIKLIKDLRQQTKELTILFSKLYEFLPEHELLEGKRKKISKAEIKKMKSKTKKARKTVSDSEAESELERLNSSLSAIESKLKSL